MIFSKLDYIAVEAQNFALLPFFVRLRLNDAAPENTEEKRTVEDAGPYKGMKKTYFSNLARTVSMYFFGEMPVSALKAREK